LLLTAKSNCNCAEGKIMAGEKSYLGRFVWYDLMTSDPAASTRFYSKLFGWTAKEDAPGSTGPYTMLLNGPKEFGGMVPIEKGRPIPSHWVGYVAVADINAAAARVAGLGGKVAHPPTEIPGVGHFAVILDPQGAAFCLYQGRETESAEDGQIPSGPRTVAWNELLCTDPPAVARFYNEVCGWTTREMDMGPMGTYWIFMCNGRDCAGMMKMPPDAQGPPAWLCYFEVTDVDASTALTRELGGMIHVAPRDISGIGRFSVTADSTGATFALFKPAPR
jgi:uncharacterized protein